MVTTVIDYLIVPTEPARYRDATPAGWNGAVVLPGDVRIERVDGALAGRLMDACELRGERWNPARQFGCIHAFVTDISRERWEQKLYAWDDEQALYYALALSRLVRPHATACDYAVRRLIDDDASERLVPYDAGEARVAFRIEDGTTGWLDEGEAGELAALMRVYAAATLPSRARRAFRFAELMVRERYLEDALPLVVGGLEALLKIGRSYLSAQFEQRAPALASELGIALSPSQCEQAYDDRSALVHGAHVDLSATPARTDFVVALDGLQQTLRGAVRRAIEDSAFASGFDDDAQITTRWPTTITPKNGASFRV
jgi:hypothetical protein